MKNSTTIFVAGGTAGHVFAANGMAYFSKTRNIIITDARGRKYVDEELFDEIHILSVTNKIFTNFFGFIKSFFQSWKFINRKDNSVIVGFGAYVSIPPCLIGWLKNKHVYLYQSDQIMGRANKLLSFFSKKIFTSSFNINHKKAECIGLIPRSNIISYPLDFNDELRILILGGSLSSTFWKIVIPAALNSLPKEILSKIKIHQQVGEDYDYFCKVYQNIPIKHAKLDKFIDTATALPWSNLVISRAGMGTIADLTASLRPALVVPWANAKDDHQTYNAQWWASSLGGWYVSEQQFTPEFLQNFIINIFNSNELKEKAKNLTRWMPIHGGLMGLKFIDKYSKR
ncbi:MAG: UDP-N-acetylglucosamine--N-acetylmuramyl-(pentapeptide) pyrophosphoryl-undecaprenol N-acetylglucosamine transferase [Alphaproteobacteria bacterium]|nr:MAG: UDP-N-acetylglucosamine--N-acetylmuramyl-(pentapeptide) pyrophosphoryl-undecaprenol N-acetylglucosamine transferase [Alphaproteobacteria bacterium]